MTILTLRNIALAMLAISCGSHASARAPGSQQVVSLWPSSGSRTAAPGRDEIAYQSEFPAHSGKFIGLVRNISRPTLTIFRPARQIANGTAIIVCPGGAYTVLAWDHEGVQVAHWLAARGITAFVLKYRVLPTPPDPKAFQAVSEAQGTAIGGDLDGWLRSMARYRERATDDAKQAVRVVRAHVAAWGIRPDRIGMMGFSAGADLTMMVAMDPARETRLDFAVPIYGFKMDPSPVPATAPPLFIIATQADQIVPVAKSVAIFDAWNAARRPAELHIYAQGPHGFGISDLGLPVDHWREPFETWLASNGLTATHSLRRKRNAGLKGASAP